jgi:CheY-like chemotaxis protein
MHVVRDGEEALGYLSGTDKYSNLAEYPLPWLVLLDLKMPRMDGFEVLKWIRNQSGIHNLVVVVLTSSGEIKDVNRAYGLGANSFMVKPLEFQNTEAIAALIDQYWLQRNQHPESARHDPKTKRPEAVRTNT